MSKGKTPYVEALEAAEAKVTPTAPPDERTIDVWLERVCQSAIPIPRWAFSNRPGYYDGVLHLPMIPSVVTMRHCFMHYAISLAADGKLTGPGIERAIKGLCGPTFADDDCSHCSNPADPTA